MSLIQDFSWNPATLLKRWQQTGSMVKGDALGNADDIALAGGSAAQCLPLLARGLEDRRERLDDVFSQEVVQRVVTLFRKCRLHAAYLNGPYEIKGEWASYLAERRGLYRVFDIGDLPRVHDLLIDFWRNAFSPMVANYEYYHSLCTGRRASRVSFLRLFLNDYRTWIRLIGGEVAQLDAPTTGNAWGVACGSSLIVPQAFRFHRNARVILDMLQDVPHPVVAELGGGYGGMAYYLLRERPELTYINCDLPETLVLAAFYLAKAFPDRKIYWFTEPDSLPDDVLRRYHIVLIPHYAIEMLGNQSVDLFHNAISLSEMPPETIAGYLTHIQRITRRYFYHVNLDVDSVMNRGFLRIAASKFPIHTTCFKRLLRICDPYFGPDGSYYEFLYERCGVPDATTTLSR